MKIKEFRIGNIINIQGRDVSVLTIHTQKGNSNKSFTYDHLLSEKRNPTDIVSNVYCHAKYFILAILIVIYLPVIWLKYFLLNHIKIK